METSASVIVFLSLVALSACDGNSRTFSSSGSYTDTLLNGIRRMENQARRKVSAVGSVVSNAIVDECYPRCPIGTVCAIDFGVRRCVDAPVVATAAVSTGYRDPIIASASIGTTYDEPAIAVVGSGYNDPALATVGFRDGYSDPVLASDISYDGGVVVSGAAHLDGLGIGVRGDLDYGHNAVRFAGCGIVPPECRANQVNPGFLSGVYKYTFDYTVNRCVQVSVCSTCATLSGPEDNLFNSYFSCNRACQ